MKRRPALMNWALLFLAPTVGEFLLGNIPISQYASVVVLVPLYGAGALLVREAGRRCGGWPTMALFAAAYALIEEGPVDQMVFNPGYLGQETFPEGSVIPGLGISGSLVVYSLALHTVWSICVPIAMVEAFDPTPTEPWLRVRGLVVTSVVFVAGCVFLGLSQAHDLDFVGTPTQFAVSGVAIIVLVVLGVWLGRRPDPTPLPGKAPRPWPVGLAAFVLTSGYGLVSDVPTALAQAALLAAAAALGVALISRWSRRTGWDGRQRLAAVALVVALGSARSPAGRSGPSRQGWCRMSGG